MKNVIAYLSLFAVLLFSCSDDKITNQETAISIGGFWEGATTDSIISIYILMELYQEGHTIKTLDPATVILTEFDGIQVIRNSHAFNITGEFYYPEVSLSYMDYSGQLFGMDSILGRLNNGDSMIFVRKNLINNGITKAFKRR